MEKTGSCILHAYRIDGRGNGNPLSHDEASDVAKSEDLAWVHLDAGHAGTRGWLEREVSYLDKIILDALLAEETRPRIMEFDNGILLILRGVNLNENESPEDMVSIRLWIDGHRIISLRRRRLKAVQDIRTMLEEGRGPKNSGDFLCMLIARLFERMEPVLTDLDEQTDDIEERVMEDPEIEERQDIINIRKEAITLRRYIAPQRDVIMHLRTSEMAWLEPMHKRHLQESLDRVVRYTEDLDMIRERAQIVKDELVNALSDRLNRNMYVLSVIASIFLPLGFFTGLLGINVGGIPGAENSEAFYIFCGLLVVLVIAQIIIFKKLKWF
ncbi:MAG: zinc transporter ZntB [Alphaproteobacteria bacterium CG_4_9_14_3_um_filter_47_13]|nr:MAG: zinc transporter ZntB [Alphaproteobacteria bacterium CG_4_9_14_3_um_filter_47_13]